MKQYPYQNLIGALMYLSVTTRPDISFAVNLLNQFNSSFNVKHWKAANRVLRYLKGTINYGIFYQQNEDDLFGVVDADWGADLNDRRSYFGLAFLFSGGAISWEAKKQRTVALSSTEAEYLATSEATKEAIYLSLLLDAVSIPQSRVKMFNDNQSTHKLIENFGFQHRTKHGDIRHHFIRNAIQDGKI